MRQRQSQIHGNQRGGGRLGFQSKKPNNQDKSSGSVGKRQIGGKKKNRLGNQGRSDYFEGSKLEGILSNGHFLISARDDI